MTDDAGIRYTHGHHESVLRSHRWRTAENSAAYLLARLAPGHRRCSTSGCGPGTITVDLARRVAPGRSSAWTGPAEALGPRRRSPPTACRSRFAPATSTPCPSTTATFDVVHAHQVLQHLDDPVAALREMARVCRPERLVAARDGDYDVDVLVSRPTPELDRWLDLYRRTARANGGEPDAGRRLVAWAAAAGCRDIVATRSAWCFATPEDRRWWAETWAERITVTALAEPHHRARPGRRGAELDAIAPGWLRWADEPDGWFAVLHGEVLCRPG